jgi:TPR repeat protein
MAAMRWPSVVLTLGALALSGGRAYAQSNSPEQLRILRDAAANGSAAAHYALGARAEENGAMAEAVARYQQAALMGYHAAQYNLAKLLESGNGVPQDLMAAEAWYRTAAKANFPPAVARIERLDAARQYEESLRRQRGTAPAPSAAASPAAATSPPSAPSAPPIRPAADWTQIAVYGLVALAALGAMIALPTFGGRRRRRA